MFDPLPKSYDAWKTYYPDNDAEEVQLQCYVCDSIYMYADDYNEGEVCPNCKEDVLQVHEVPESCTCVGNCYCQRFPITTYMQLHNRYAGKH